MADSNRSRLSKLTDVRWVAARLFLLGEDLIRRRKLHFYLNPSKVSAFAGTLTEIDESLSSELRSSSDFPYSSETMEARVRDGHKLYALTEKGEHVCFGWLSPSSEMFVDELGKTVSANRPVRWIWDCVTPTSNRGKGYYTRMLRSFLAKFPAPEPLGIFCSSRNQASKRGIESAGFQSWFDITGSCLGTRIQSSDPKTKDQINFR